MCRREPNRPSADHCNPVSKFRLLPPTIDVDRMFGFGPIALGQESLERANRDGLIDLSTTTSGLARMSAYATTNRSQWIRIAGKLISFFESPFRDHPHISAGIRVGRTGHHAGEIGGQPIS